jgi:hypothetical protein
MGIQLLRADKKCFKNCGGETFDETATPKTEKEIILR